MARACALGRPLLLGLVAFLPIGTLRADLAEHYRIRDTVTDCLNVRPEPDVSTDPIVCLTAGTAVTVVGTVPYWRQIELPDGRRGWAAKKYLEPSEQPAISPADQSIPADAFLEVHFVDVGQGDAIWIHTYDDGIDGNGRFEGRNIVIDGGPSSSDAGNHFLQYLEDAGHHGAVVDALIVTHAHTDHFRGAEAISRHFAITDYYDPGFPSTLVSYNAFLAAIQGSDGNPPRAQRVHLGQANFGTLSWGNELKVEILYAWPGVNTGLGPGNTLVNNSSIVVRLEYGENVFLFMGDAEGKDRHAAAATPNFAEKILLGTVPDRLKATVLKIAHHGSETSSTTPFIQAVDPAIVVVMSGRKNFGGVFLPDKTTLQRYCDHNADTRIYRTDQDDAADGLNEGASADGDNVVIRSNGHGMPSVKAFSGGAPITMSSCKS